MSELSAEELERLRDAELVARAEAVADEEGVEPVESVEPDEEEEEQHSDPATLEPEDEPQAYACPLCQGAGVLPIEPHQDPTVEPCPDCGGVGMVYTGSLIPEHATRDCSRCQGRGFAEKTPAIPVFVDDLPSVDVSLEPEDYELPAEVDAIARAAGGVQ